MLGYPNYSPLAQGLEQSSYKAKVLGSIPRWTTIYFPVD